jgi:hypothetical protein
VHKSPKNSSGNTLEKFILLSKVWEGNQGLLSRERNVSDCLVPSGVTAASHADQLLHAVERNVNHFVRPDWIQGAIGLLERLCVRVDQDRPDEVLASRVDRNRCRLSAALLSEFVEDIPELVELFSEWISWNIVESAAGVTLALAKSHLLNSDRLWNASQ